MYTNSYYNKWKLLLDNNNKSYNNSSTSSNIVINNNGLDYFIKVFYSNSRSLSNTLPTLLSKIQSHEYNIIIFTETWINDEITDGMLLNGTKIQVGGILIYINRLFPAHNLQFTENLYLLIIL